ncbi:MAG: RnfABCDGE type electron transport complex subunit B [Gemmatimonadota bacterium]
MEPGSILGAAAILGGLGFTFGTLIAIANRKLYVWEDPRIDALSDILPGVNCGACGFAGCRAFAEATIGGEAVPAGCTVIGEPEREEVADLLGVDVGEAVVRTARLLCAGGSDVAPFRADYRGIESCAAAVAVSGGGKACAWGCVGLADCAVACTFDAIRMSDTDLPLVDPDRCTACGDCVDACPLDLFVLLPRDAPLIVQCRSLLEGEDATDVCAVACNACGRCAMDAAPGLIEMRDGLAVVDYDQIALADPGAVARCPTGAIRWVEGAQTFEASLALAGSETG